MEVIVKKNPILDKIQSFEVFQGVEQEALEWLIDRSECTLFEDGEIIFQPGREADTMLVVVEGQFSVTLERNGKMKDYGLSGPGTVTGVLPFSRMKETKAIGTAVGPCSIMTLHRNCFVEMVNVSYKLTQALVSVMTNRVRQFSRARSQDEKLMALGKLSAGLAHELNNPASAMVRNAEELSKKVHYTPEKFKSVITMRISPEKTDKVNAIVFEKAKNVEGVELSLMDREERVDDINDWLEDRDVPDIGDIAETFVDFGFVVDELEEIEEIMEGEYIFPIVRWIENTLSMEKIVYEIKEAADRISSLVRSVKDYSHMDKGDAIEPTDVLDGIRTTAMILKHKIKQKNIQFVKNIQPDLPKVLAHPGELNQVWTNILDNAIDALEPGGTITISTYTDRQFVCVDIIDNGPGIPEDIQTRVFEPFFTTKAMGKGTGMGLDIVKRIIERHNGDISLESKPGETKFSLCFPAVQK